MLHNATVKASNAGNGETGETFVATLTQKAITMSKQWKNVNSYLSVKAVHLSRLHSLFHHLLVDPQWLKACSHRLPGRH